LKFTGPLPFDPQLLAEIVGLSTAVSELNTVKREVAFGKGQVSELFNAERVAQDVVDSWLPSQIVKFDLVEASFIQLRKVQLQRSGLNGSIAKLQSRDTSLTNTLRHSFSKIEKAVRCLIVANGGGNFTVVSKNGYTENVTVVDQLFARVRGDLLARVDALLSLCRELGAQLPEGAS